MARPDPIPFDTHRLVKRLTSEGMPAGQAEALADEQISLIHSNLVTKQDLSNLVTKDDLAATNEKLAATNEAVARCVTKEEFTRLGRRVNTLAEDVAVLKSDMRTLKWVVAGVGFGMVAVTLGVSSLVIKIFWMD